MIREIQIEGPEDTHPEKPVYDAHDLASGKVDLSSLPVSRHETRVFDLLDDDQRKAYDSLYMELTQKSKRGSVLVSDNRRDILTRPDGSTGWFKLIEWTEYDTSEILGA